MKLKENNLGYTVAILSIFTAFIMITEWKKYEQKIINDSAKPVIDSLNYDATVSFKTAEKINLLEKMAMAEREKIKVMIEHDNSPLTKTYPMILDATNSFDPDVGDNIQYVWKQISGNKVEIMPNPFSGKVSFEAEAGEYTFELTVSDDYGSKATTTRTVVIEPEPNMPPIIDMVVRQGSELN